MNRSRTPSVDFSTLAQAAGGHPEPALKGIVSAVLSKDISAYQYVLLIAVTVVAALLRFYKLGEWSFNIDEMLTIERSKDVFQKLFSGEYGLGILLQKSPSHLLTNLPLAIWDVNHWSARLAPALMGIISIPVFYFPVRRMFGPAVGLLSVLLLAVSPWHLHWSQNARFYTPLLFFYMLALFAFYFGLEENRPVYLIGAIVLFVLAVQERLLAGYFVPVVAGYTILVVIFRLAKPFGPWFRNALLVIVVSLGIMLLKSIGFIAEPTNWVDNFGLDRVLESPTSILRTLIAWIGLPMFGMAAAGTVYLLGERHRAALLLGISAVLPVFVAVGAAFFQFSTDRYAFVALISWIVLASLATVKLFTHLSGWSRVLAAGVLMILLVGPVFADISYFRQSTGNRSNWQGGFELVRQQREPGDLVMTNKVQLGRYYIGEEVIDMSLTTTDSPITPDVVEKMDERIWFVENYALSRVAPEMQDWIETNCELVYSVDILVHRCEP